MVTTAYKGWSPEAIVVALSAGLTKIIEQNSKS